MDHWTVDRGAKRVVGIPDSMEPDAAEQRQIEHFKEQLLGHLNKGKSLAYYENQDLGHRDIGHVMCFTFGTPEAQFETPEPPERCPDGLAREITGGINWRYQLVGVTRAIPTIVDTVPAEEG